MMAAMFALPSTAAEIGDSLKTDTVAKKKLNGKYIYVPDSLQNEVLKLLTGNYKVVDDEENLDLKERVLWKGDTIPMVLKTRNLGRYDRGLSNFLYIPKGEWTFGLTASYGEFNTEDLQMFDLMSDINLGAKIFSIKPYALFFLRNNLAVGLRLGYTSAEGDVNSLKFDYDEDISFDLHDIMYRNRSFQAAFVLRQYVGIGRRGRFAVFNDVELAFSAGNSDFIRPYNEKLTNTHTSFSEYGLNFSPGVSVFVMKNVSFNVSFGAFGLYLHNSNQTQDGEKIGNRTTSGANFRLNLFNINFGIGIHI